MSLKKMTCIEDLHQVFKRKTPKMFFDYCDSGSWTEGTYKNNESDFNKIKFRQRVAVDMNNRTLKTNILGQEYSMPVVLAPVGFTGMQWAEGEILAAKAAAEFGVPYTLSTMSICSIEDIVEKSKTPFYFQIYVMKDKEFRNNLIERAKKANCSALVITLDLQVLGQRHKDIKNGLTAPPRPTIPNIINLMTKPQWCLNMVKTNKHTFRNIVGHAKTVSNLSSLSSWTNEQFDPSLDWDDIREIKDLWGGQVILKGIMEVQDAIKAMELRPQAIVVSNHGGRQLDGAPSTISVLPEIVKAVRDYEKEHAEELNGHRTEIWIDSGIRSGQDILRAKALGADACMIGRSYIYGLGAYGQAGVTRSLEILENELSITMAFCGHTNINNVDSSILRPSALFAPDMEFYKKED